MIQPNRRRGIIIIIILKLLLFQSHQSLYRLRHKKFDIRHPSPRIQSSVFCHKMNQLSAQLMLLAQLDLRNEVDLYKYLFYYIFIKKIQEIEQYLLDPSLSKDDDPLDYWRIKSNLPTLRNLARRYLSAPPGSVESERLFSTLGQTGIYKPKRSRLSGENAEKLLFLHHHM